MHNVIIALSFLFAIILLFQGGNRLTANIFLSVFLLAIAFQFFFIALTESELLPNDWIKYNTVFGFLYGPSIYFYIIYLVDSRYRLRVRDMLHFLPPILVVLGLTFIPDSTRVFAIIMYLSLVIYAFVEAKLIIRFGRMLKSGRWKKPNDTLEWLKYFMGLFIALIFFDLIDQTIFYFFSPFGISIVHVGLIVLISWMFYRAFNQPELFRTSSSVFAKTKGNRWENRRDHLKDLSANLNLKESLGTHLMESKSYLLPNLTLEDLANRLNTTPQALSSTINSNFNVNFSTYINMFRVDHAKEMLKRYSKSQKSISEIMYDSGFSSKSSFNTIFRESTGVTPSQFREMEQKAD
ncbi:MULTISPECIES: helix-turn-helix domain-containing protein [Flavobacteriaceae]|uniref:helix-turn-helix domain-containing protein n=1 Tax=Flavobacteriaceae TaxID=49546 RepID=UPI0014926629|nr:MULTISPECIES: helix-turn-helix transcriptional regulator [Allomuricauda]MDC6366656.1 helix-turn-helix transcriptional regulator [Muricauda sp. AC10]